MTRDELIERVARAITRTDFLGSSEQGRTAYVEARWRDYQELARAAIAAMPGAAEIERLRDEVEHWKQARAEALAGGDVLRAEIERLRKRISSLEGSRRERIATACLAGLMADPNVDHAPDDMADCAVRFADAFIARLDKEAKP